MSESLTVMVAGHQLSLENLRAIVRRTDPKRLPVAEKAIELWRPILALARKPKLDGTDMIAIMHAAQRVDVLVRSLELPVQ